jgi:hypothetical protein
MVSLVQLLAKLSESITILDEFVLLEVETEKVCMMFCKAMEGIVALFLGLMLMRVFRFFWRPERNK